MQFIAFSIVQGIVINLHAEGLKKQYKTRDEKREAAHQYELTDWLSLSAIAEIEQGRQRRKPLVGEKSKTDEFSKSLDVEAIIEVSETVKGEVVFEFDDEKGGIFVDEAVAIIDFKKTEIELGKTYLPFGEYYSHFVTGPSVDFAETSGKGIVVSHSPKQGIDLSLYAYKGKAKKVDTEGHSIDWGIAAEINPSDSLIFGVGYISDLADAKDLSENHTSYVKRVDGASIHVEIKTKNIEFTTEYITALDSFNELETDRNRPRAWNIELAHYPTEKFGLALRLAGSKELEDEPHQQYGVSGTWFMNSKISVTLEYLRNKYKVLNIKYKEGLAEDSQERALKKSNEVAGRLSILF